MPRETADELIRGLLDQAGGQSMRLWLAGGVVEGTLTRSQPETKEVVQIRTANPWRDIYVRIAAIAAVSHD